MNKIFFITNAKSEWINNQSFQEIQITRPHYRMINFLPKGQCLHSKDLILTSSLGIFFKKKSKRKVFHNVLAGTKRKRFNIKSIDPRRPSRCLYLIRSRLITRRTSRWIRRILKKLNRIRSL